MKHLLKLIDLEPDEINEVLDLTADLKVKQKAGISHKLLEGKTLGLIFQKSSTRTRVSFEVGMYQLGGHALFLNTNDLQIGRGESIEDTARVLSRYLDGIMIRTYNQSDVEILAKAGSIPVINGLTDFAHPCQILADLLTIKEYKGNLKGLKLAFVGDGNNVANSLIVGGLKVGMQVSIACPCGYTPDKAVLDFAAHYPGGFVMTDDLKVALKDADVVYTDVWASMGQEDEKHKRAAAFASYQVNEALMATAHPGAIVLHCLPAHKEEEISAAVFEAHADEIFDQAENRLHVQKAVLVKLMA